MRQSRDTFKPMKGPRENKYSYRVKKPFKQYLDTCISEWWLIKIYSI